LQISDAGKPCESKESHAHADEEEIRKSEIDKEEDMAFQLNPEAAEFVPLSPPLRGNRNFLQDYPISGSPLRQTPAMDDIPVPTQSEFEEEVCRRPREIDEKDFSSEAYVTDQQNSVHDMDVSEISSTKAEMGDESMARIMSSTQWQTDLSSQWSEKARDDEGSESEEYATVMKNNSMTMSYTPGDFKAAFETGVDLNAVHDLNVSSDSAEFANSPSRSPEPYEYDERAHTPLSDNKDPIDHLRASSTPQAISEKLLPDITAVFDSDETKMDVFSDLKTETLLGEEQLLDISPMNQTDASLNEFLSIDTPTKFSSDECKSVNSTLVMNTASKSSELSELNEFIDPIDHKSQPENTEFKMHDEQSLLSAESTLSHTESSLPEEPITQDDRENAEFMKEEVYEEQSKEKQELYEIEADKDVQSTDPLLIPDTLECTSQSTEITESKMPIPEIPSDTTNNLIFMQNDFISNLSPNTNVEKSTELLSLDSEIQCPESNAAEVDATIGNIQPPTFAGSSSYIKNEALLLNKDPDPNLNRSENLLIHDIEPLIKSEEEQKDSSNIVNIESNIESFDVKQDTCVLMSRNVDTLLYPFDTSMKQQELHESQAPEEAPLLNDKQIRQEEIKEEAEKVTSTNVTETFEEKIESENIPLSKEVSTTVSEDIGVMDTSKKEETVVEPIDTSTAEVITGAAIAAIPPISIAKSKTTTTTTAKRSMKATTTTTKATPSTKTMTKSTPTSPSKTFSATARTTVTSSTQSTTTTKKPAASSAARPRQLDSSTKSAVSSAGGKTTVTKTAVISAKTTTATAKTTASPRVGTGTAKPRVTGTASPRPNITGASTERKPTASGDAKLISKSAAKPTSTTLKTATSNVKTTLAKSSSTTTRTSTMTSKPRPASAAKTTSATAIKQLSTSATTSAPRPKTAPVTSSTIKPRENITRTTTTKSPMTDKQSKETVNKQISRAGTLSTSKPSTRLSTSGVTSTSSTVKRASGKSVSNTSATSPTKKPTPISKVTSKTSVGIKRTPSSEAKVLQNGILEKKEDRIKTTVITAAGDKLEDDVLRKDASPINMPTDNQLITD